MIDDFIDAINLNLGIKLFPNLAAQGFFGAFSGVNLAAGDT